MHEPPSTPPSEFVGTVYLVGAGPGDPELLTVRGAKLLRDAGAVVYDALVNPVLLEQAPPEAERFDVGRRKGEKHIDLDQIGALLARLARQYPVVVRLKGGDPFVFGRGGEEAMALARAGIRYEVVPGVTSGVAAPAYAGIPLTHRGLSSVVTFTTGHLVSGRTDREELPSPATSDDGTLVIFMGLARIQDIANELVRCGRPPDTPAAVVDSGTHPSQRTVTGTLADIAHRARTAGLVGPALIVVGDVVRLRDTIHWRPEVPAGPTEDMGPDSSG